MATTKEQLREKLLEVKVKMDELGSIYDNQDSSIPLFDEMDSLINDSLRIMESLIK
jgi:hypothetical protein